MPAGVACSDFDVVLTFLVSKEYAITLSDKSGEPTRQVITGALVITVTRVGTGASVTVNASGPGHFDLAAGEFIANGHLLQWLPGSLKLYTGRRDYLTTEGHGTVLLDVCAALS